MKELTLRQRQLLEVIAGYARQRGYPPTVREMAAELGVSSPNGINDHLRALEQKGYIARARGSKSRAISLLRPPSTGARGHTTSVPLLGRVAAGGPVLSEENYSGAIELDRTLVPGRGRLFALRVSGDSMVGKGILEGDTVIVRAASQAVPGETVVALLDGEATVKILARGRAGFVLQPANPAYPPINLGQGRYASASIVGVVVGLVRTYPG